MSEGGFSGGDVGIETAPIPPIVVPEEKHLQLLEYYMQSLERSTFPWHEDDIIKYMQEILKKDSYFHEYAFEWFFLVAFKEEL